MKAETINEGIKILAERDGIDIGGSYVPAGLTDFTAFYMTENGKKLPLTVWRFHEKFRGIKNTIGELLGEVSSMKAYSLAPRTTNLKSLIYQEVDLAEWWLDSHTKYITAVINGPTANIILKMENGRVGTLELAATLPEGAETQYKHEVYSTHGQVCDRAVDTQVVQHAIYLYNDGAVPKTYTDIDFSLFGLTPAEVDTVYNIYWLAKGRIDLTELEANDIRLKRVVLKCFEAAEKNRRLEIMEVR